MRGDEDWQEMITYGALADIPVHYLKETGSTNQVARVMAERGAPTYSLVIADSQTEGRGRLGKKWLSPAGTGLYFSVILRPLLPPEDLPKITLAAGLAVALAVEKITDLSPMLKWPNDLLLDGKKLGGILAETVNLQGEPSAVLLGIGLNVNSPITAFPADLQGRVTSLLIQTGNEFRRSVLLSSICTGLKKQIQRFERSGFQGILGDWRKLDVTLGRELIWVTRKGLVVRGVSLGPDDTGQLLIEDEKGHVHEILSGDISLARGN